MYLVEDYELFCDVLYNDQWQIVEKRQFETYEDWCKHDGMAKDYGYIVTTTLNAVDPPGRIENKHPSAFFYKLERAE